MKLTLQQIDQISELMHDLKDIRNTKIDTLREIERLETNIEELKDDLNNLNTEQDTVGKELTILKEQWGIDVHV